MRANVFPCFSSEFDQLWLLMLLQLNVGMKSDMFPFPRHRVREDNLNSLLYAAVFSSPFTFFLVAKVECPFWIHPGRLTWNQKVTQVERKLIFQTSMIRFHVNLQGCSCSGLILHFDLPQESSHKEWHLQACFVLRVVATGEKERAAENRWLHQTSASTSLKCKIGNSKNPHQSTSICLKFHIWRVTIKASHWGPPFLKRVPRNRIEALTEQRPMLRSTSESGLGMLRFLLGKHLQTTPQIKNKKLVMCLVVWKLILIMVYCNPM